ncbi:MAG: hypothetical protein COB41_10105 [Proteobacteria bacterium]|nr:MAG: hypothetical protein COB41_10105 [Pseudomonadota bacterium]
MKIAFYSLRSRIFFSFTAIIAILSLFFGWTSALQQTSSLEKELFERGQITARHLAYSVELGILTGNIPELGKLLEKLMQEKDMRYAEVYNANGELIALSAHTEHSEQLNTTWAHPDIGIKDPHLPSQKIWLKGKLEGDEVYAFHMPVISEINATEESILFADTTHMSKQSVGSVYVFLSTQSIRSATAQTIKQGIESFVVLLLFAMLAAWWLARALSRPLEHMIGVIEKTKSGDFSHRIKPMGQSEVAKLGLAFNRMCETLQERDKSLHTQQRTMQVLFDTAPIAIWMLDKNRRITFMNHAFSSAVGISEQSFVDAANYAELFPEKVASQCMKSDAQCFEAEDLISSQEYIPCVDGKTHVFDIVKAPLKDEQGNMTGLVGIAIDATDRLQADAEKEHMQKQVDHTQRLESLGVLAGGIAHDFNNILTSIMGNASLAERKIMSDPLTSQSHLSKIILSSEKAALLCKQMLAYSGKGHFIIKPINLSNMVRGVTSLLGVSIHKAVGLKLQLSEQLPNINADEAQLQQIIMNLVINASDAIEKARGVITISTDHMYADAKYLAQLPIDPSITLDAGDYVYLEVSDTGCGMDKATQKRMFEPFFTTKFTGRGLGMSAVQGIVRGHKGAMCLYSEPGKGTTFKILFPATQDSLKITSSPTTLRSDDWQANGTILIIDDEEMIRETASIMLGDMGYDILTAVDGLDGLHVYRQHQHEIVAVLLDITMPKLSGEGCFRELKLINPHVKIVLSSGYTEQDAISRFTDKGLKGFVQKPYRPEQLEEVIHKVTSDKT